jgi:hypothetical protein
MIWIVSLLIGLPMLESVGLTASGGWDFGSVVAPIAIALIIGFAVIAVGLAIRHDV